MSSSLVTESVTIVVPGSLSFKIAPSSAIRVFLFISLPSLSTTLALSTSVSNIIPRSASAARVALQTASIASLFSGFGMWFGKLPSGSKNTLPSVLAPSGESIFSAKNPPAPFPASTIILNPESGVSPAFISSRILETRYPLYDEIRSFSVTCPPLTSTKLFVVAMETSSAISAFSRPPSFVKNFIPFRLNGRWLAVSIIPPSQLKSGSTVLIKIDGVDARAQS